MDSDIDGKTRVTAMAPHLLRQRGDDCLVIIHAPTHAELGKRVVLDRDLTTLGRGPDNDVVLASDCVSRKHGRIERRAGQLWLIDLNSTNGTYLNDVQKISAPYQLQCGDQVMIGDVILKYLSGGDVEAQYHEIIFQMTITDGLTGTCNRKQLDQLLTAELAHAERHQRPLSLLMMDIDHFKRINDSHGHLAGDTVLRSLASLLQKRLRNQDRLGRYGGEEFCLLLPETPLSSAAQLAEELRTLVAGSEFTTDEQTIHVTLSIGVATHQAGMSMSALYAQADAMLYNAKRAGRNQVKSM